MRNLLVATTAAALLSAGAANAASVNYTTGLPLSFSTTEIFGTLSVPKFDNMGGMLILEGVDFSITGAIQGTIVLTNGAAQAQNVLASTISDMYLSSSLLSVGTAPQISLSGGTGLQVVPASGVIGPIAVADSDVFVGSQFSGLSSFVGAGTVDVDYFSISGVSVQGGGGNVAAGQSTEGAIGMSITYTYREAPPPPETVVPVPAALPLLATGLGLFGLMRLRRKSN